MHQTASACCLALCFSLFPPNYFIEAELFIPSSKSEVRLFGALGSPSNDWWPWEAERLEHTEAAPLSFCGGAALSSQEGLQRGTRTAVGFEVEVPACLQAMAEIKRSVSGASSTVHCCPCLFRSFYLENFCVSIFKFSPFCIILWKEAFVCKKIVRFTFNRL